MDEVSLCSVGISVSLKSLSKPILLELYSYLYHPNYKFLEWIDVENLNIHNLVRNYNPGYIDMLLHEKIECVYNIINLSSTDVIKNYRLNDFCNKFNITVTDRQQTDTRTPDIYIPTICPSQNPYKFPSVIESHSPPEYVPEVFTENYFIKLCKNPSQHSVQLLQQHIGNLTQDCWIQLCSRPNVTTLEFVEKYKESLTEECWLQLCENPSQLTVNFINRNIDKLDNFCWERLCYNPSEQTVGRLLYPNTSKFNVNCWENLCFNLNSRIAVKIVENNLDQLNLECMEYLCENPSDRVFGILYGLVGRLDIYCWNGICKNQNPLVVDLIKSNLDKFPLRCWEKLCSNTTLDIVELLNNNIRKLDDRCWTNLCKNDNNDILSEIVGKNIDKLVHRVCWYSCWNSLTENKNRIATDILKSVLPHLENKLDFWSKLSLNPNIVEVDFELTRVMRDKWYQNNFNKI